jgi:hypothetical protein
MILCFYPTHLVFPSVSINNIIKFYYHVFNYLSIIGIQGESVSPMHPTFLSHTIILKMNDKWCYWKKN